MPDDFTVCTSCMNCIMDGANHPRYYMCAKHKRMGEGFGFVTDTVWDRRAPMLYCVDCNGGACPLFEPLKEGD